jgi:type IV secretion system protein TrbL
MIDGTLLNQILSAFSVALDGAFAALAVYSIGLLSAFGLLHFYISMSLGLTGYIPLGEAIARFLWTIVKIGIFYWLMISLYDLMWNGAFRTFMLWGSQSGWGEAAFLDPATIMRRGFEAAYPIKVWVDKFIGVTAPFYLVDIGMGTLAYWLTVFSFGTMALAVMMAIIEFKLALATAAVLLPWAVFTHTAFIGELSISWMVAGLVRILVTGLLMGVAQPLFALLTVPTPTWAGPDPSAFHGAGAWRPRLHRVGLGHPQPRRRHRRAGDGARADRRRSGRGRHGRGVGGAVSATDWGRGDPWRQSTPRSGLVKSHV